MQKQNNLRKYCSHNKIVDEILRYISSPVLLLRALKKLLDLGVLLVDFIDLAVKLWSTGTGWV